MRHDYQHSPNWQAMTDAEKLSQTTGVEPTTLLRCKRDVEAILNGDDPTQ